MNDKVLVTMNSNIKFNGPSLIIGKGEVQTQAEFIKVCKEMYKAVQENNNLRIKFQLDNIGKG